MPTTNDWKTKEAASRTAAKNDDPQAAAYFNQDARKLDPPTYKGQKSYAGNTLDFVIELGEVEVLVRASSTDEWQARSLFKDASGEVGFGRDNSFKGAVEECLKHTIKDVEKALTYQNNSLAGLEYQLDQEVKKLKRKYEQREEAAKRGIKNIESLLKDLKKGL